VTGVKVKASRPRLVVSEVKVIPRPDVFEAKTTILCPRAALKVKETPGRLCLW